MKQSAKFTFENLEDHHGALSAAADLRPKKRSLTDHQIKEIQDASYAQGMLAGEDAALMRIEQRAVDSLELIVSRCTELQEEVREKIDILRKQAADLAFIISNALTPALIASNPAAEIEQLFIACVASLNAEPRIVIRVEEALVDVLKQKIDQLAHKAGYPGRIVLIGDPGALPAQCQIEWADGGVSHRSPEQLLLINQMIDEYINGGRQAAPETGSV